MFRLGYAIIPEGGQEPSAIFNDLEDAVLWALRRHGSDRFRVRHIDVLPVERDDPPRPATTPSS